MDIGSACPGQTLAATGETANKQQGHELGSGPGALGQCRAMTAGEFGNQSLPRRCAPLVDREAPASITPGDPF